MAPPLFVQADNALGSPRGDVDDAWALCALLSRDGAPVAAIASVFGNTDEPRAHENCRTLARRLGWEGRLLRGASRRGETGSEAARHLASNGEGMRVLALGPLTDVAAALAAGARPAEVIVLGANLSSRGRWPPLWPFDYNLVKDRAATEAVVSSGAPLVFFPLDVAKRLRAGVAELAALPGTTGAYLREGSLRWHRRARRLKLARSVPVWDLVPAMWILEPSLFREEERRARAYPSGRVDLAAPAGRPVRVVTGFEPEALWERFLARIA